MYIVTLVNTKDNIEQLTMLGVRSGEVTDAAYLSVQLNLMWFVYTFGYRQCESPLIDIEDVAPLLLLDSTEARIRYVYQSGAIDLDTMNHLINGIVGG